LSGIVTIPLKAALFGPKRAVEAALTGRKFGVISAVNASLVGTAIRLGTEVIA